MAAPKERTEDGFETHFGTNHLAHFLLFQLLKPAMLASSTPQFNSRVVVVTSIGHSFSPIHFDDLDLSKTGRDDFIAYGQSKTANIYMVTEIERRYASRGLHANAVHPGGIIQTGISRFVTEEMKAA
jgi:NAD(P)-dependent dehydrogenase (short-subunit alcohol dehydrogenase family)